MSPRRSPKPAREYSRAFPLSPRAKRRQLVVDMPHELHAAVVERAKRDGRSVRSVVLTFLQEWSGTRG